tara:strand:+ start:704 stop:1057 length:354 start_codon:yes stop_codon:yes gene_type:complete
MNKDSKYRSLLGRVHDQLSSSKIGAVDVYQYMLEALAEAKKTEAALREELAALKQSLAPAVTTEINPTDNQVADISRAFWRRIEPFKNEHEKELPQDMPVEFMAFMRTALMILNWKG